MTSSPPPLLNFYPASPASPVSLGGEKLDLSLLDSPMSPAHSLRGQRITVRRLALMCAALASAIALLSAITTVDASAATQPTWVVKFQNNYSKRIFVARATVNEGMCKNFGLMEIRGWLRLEPGETKTGIVTSTPRAHFYARADDGRTWEAPPGPHYYRGPVTDGVFNWCGGRTPPEAYEVRMREIYLPDNPNPQTLRWTRTIHLMY